MTIKHIYLPGLNGLRAIAALSVVIAHISQKGIADFGIPIINVPMAGYGVTLFFVISGFLITFLLLKEKEKTHKVDVKKFYVRRILRIWPLYYLFILLCIICFVVLQNDKLILVRELWWYIFFAANIPFVFQAGILILVHLWSIGVEEQFYLFWPWVAKWGKNMLKISILFLIVFLFIKVAAYFFMGKESYFYRFFVITRFHCMMIGAIGAIMYADERGGGGKQLIINNIARSQIQIISWLIFFSVGLGFISIPSLISNELVAMISLFLIVGQIDEKGILKLEKPIFDFVGKISYGIYVIHPLVILLLSKVIKELEINITVKIIFVYFSVVFFTVSLAWLSYHFYESKFLKLKSRFTVIKSANSMKIR